MTGISESIKRDADQFIALRRDFHRNPELAFQEHRTSDIVGNLLESWGYAVERNVGKTGVVGQLRRGDGPRSIGIRADMDALPIQEATDLPYASSKSGLMHACGHDGHTAMLLAAAKAVADRSRFNGTLNLFFQPAEEYGRADSGAARMISDGLFEKYPSDAIFGMHNMPGFPQGQFIFRDGPMMASSDSVTITIDGRGGHGAVPHKAADPVVAAASIVMALQSVVARNVDPIETGVVTVGVMQAGTVANVIPQTARLELSVRALTPLVRELLERRVTAIALGQGESFGVKVDVDYRRGYAALKNTTAETEFAREIGCELTGADSIVPQTAPLTGSEDFAFMLEKRPGCYLLIGNGLPGEHGGCEVHNPGYDFNDANIVPGAAYWTLLTERYLCNAALAA